MYLIKKSKWLVLLFSTGCIIFSCNSENKGGKNKEQSPETESEQIVNEPSTSFILPSPLQIANIFKKSGLHYAPGLTNPVSNETNYSTSFSKALGLGAYSSDIAYSIVNKKPQEALNYLKVIRTLSADLGMANVFESESLLTRFENNIGNEDSLAFIIADLQIGFDSFLEDNEKEYLSVIIFTGAWIESMYIGSNSSPNIKNEKLYAKLGEQYSILNNLIKALQFHKEQNAIIPLLRDDLMTIKENFHEFGFPKEDNDEANYEIALTDENVKKLSQTIEIIRTKFINGTYQ